MNTILLVITVISIAAAVAAAAVAWRLVREERRRAEARIALLQADIHAGGAPVLEAPPPGAAHAMFADGSASAPRPRVAAIVGAGALIVASAAAVVVLSSTTGNGDDPAAASHAARESRPQPLELIALTHEREADRITIRGVVRNPRGSAAMTDVAAIVLLYNGDGFVASGRADLARHELAPGDETTFVVTVPADDVGRYRVSFRVRDRVVPHIDARKL